MVKFAKKAFHFFAQNWELLDDDLPNDIVIKAIVTVGDDIAKCNDPLVLRNPAYEVGIERIETPYRFSSNFKLALDS